MNIKKLTTSDFAAAAEEMCRGDEKKTMGLFIDEQAEIPEYIEELSEGEPGLEEGEVAFLLSLAMNVWQAMRSNGMAPLPADRKTLLALEKTNVEKMQGVFEGGVEKIITSELLLKTLSGHPQEELARAALLLVLSYGEKKNGVAPDMVFVPAMVIVDFLSGVRPREELLEELNDLPPRRWRGIADFRLTEPSLDHTSRLMAGKNPSSLEEANAFLREHCVGKLVRTPPANPLQAAQDIIYKAMDSHSPQVRTHLAGKALSIFPDCADAYNLLAEEEAETDEAALELYRRGIEAGARALGAKLEEARGKLWANFNARPYMRARSGEAHTLWEMGMREEAERAYYELLRLNKNDNQGIRYTLLAFHAEKMEFGRMDALINSGDYLDDCAAEWLYTKALAAFALGKPDASLFLKKALEANTNVPYYMLGDRQPPDEYYHDSVAMGGADEAWSYAMSFKKAWAGTPGALIWLSTGQKALDAPKAGRNDACPCGSGKKYKKCCGRLR